MILAIDMGNTRIVIGCIDNNKIYFVEELSTNHMNTALEYAMGFKTVLELYDIRREDIDDAIISCVVPPLLPVITDAAAKIIGRQPKVVGPGLKTGLNILMDNPKQLGSDLVVDAVAGINEYGAPLIIIDMGTATTFAVIDDSRNYIGGALMPGMQLSMDALAASAAQLYRVSLETPSKVIGRNTTDCMKSGLLLGTASSIDGMIERIQNELGYETTVIATGHSAKDIMPLCRHDVIIDDMLLLKGLKIIYYKNYHEGNR